LQTPAISFNGRQYMNNQTLFTPDPLDSRTLSKRIVLAPLTCNRAAGA